MLKQIWKRISHSVNLMKCQPVHRLQKVLMSLILKMKLNRKTFSWSCGRFANLREMKYYEGNNK